MTIVTNTTHLTDKTQTGEERDDRHQLHGDERNHKTEGHRPHRFEPRFTTKDSGNGFGLAVCHRVIANHRGTISVASSPGKGAIFTIAIPLLRRSKECSVPV